MTERTLVLVKPDGVQRLLVGRILARFEERGLKLVGLKLVHVDRALAERHYAVHREKPFFETAQNLIHASDGAETATAELALWFGDGELLDYDREIDRWALAPEE